MNHRILCSLVFSCSLLGGGQAQEAEAKSSVYRDSPVVEDGARLVVAGDGFEFTEGPARDAEGNVYFTDQPNDRIHLWNATSGKISKFMEPCGRSNGLFLAADGSLLACADENNELWRIDVKTRKSETLLRDHEGKRFNGPNDVWVLPNGDLYFTDPFYRRNYWKHDQAEQDGQQVYFLKRGAERAVRVTEDLVQPNGIVGDAKNAWLYVADIGDRKTYRYRMGADGKLSQKQLIIEMGSDGMTIDEEGNLYLTGRGVTVVSSSGKRVEHIEIPKGWTANVCFGGADRKTLFVTALDSVFTLRMKVAGLASPAAKVP